MGSINSIKKDKVEALFAEGYGVQAVSCYFGVSTTTLGTWVRRNYNKSAKQLYLERRNGNGETTNRDR